MKKILFVLLFFIGVNLAQDISCRIRALGSDFALLIPDYETDLFYNPIFLNGNSLGLYYKPDDYIPIKINFVHNSVGFYGFYWLDYNQSLLTLTPGTGFYNRQDFKDNLRANVFSKIKNIGVSLTSEISRDRSKLSASANYQNIYSSQKFLYKSSVGLKPFKNLYLFLEPCLVSTEELDRTQNIDILHQTRFIISGRITALYRNINEENNFITAKLSVGGPVSINDIDDLPISIYTYHARFDSLGTPQQTFFNVDLGFCYGMRFGHDMLLTLGMKEKYIFQNVQHLTVWGKDSTYLGMKNRLSFPIAIEYTVNNIIFRGGVNLFYNIVYLREDALKNGNWLTQQQNTTHALGNSYTFGFGWRPKQKISVDVNTGGQNIWHLPNWSIYLRYTI